MNQRAHGIQAIIDLQAAAGVTESREAAEKGWDSMSVDEQQQTMLAHRAVCPSKTK